MAIRKIKIEDSILLLNFFKKLVVLDPERVERPEDVSKITEKMELDWVKKRIAREEKKDIFILCGLNERGEIVAEGEVEKLPRWIERHVAEIRFGLLPGYDSMGEELVKKLIETARDNHIEILTYFHLETQKTGLRIMKNLEFEPMGVIKKYYKRNGEYVNRAYLVKYL